jgi:hypothetical protein
LGARCQTYPQLEKVGVIHDAPLSEPVDEPAMP